MPLTGLGEAKIGEPNGAAHWQCQFEQRALLRASEGWFGDSGGTMRENTESSPNIAETARPRPTFIDPHVTASVEIQSDCELSSHLGIHILLCTEGHLYAQLVSSLTPRVSTPFAYVDMSLQSVHQRVHIASTVQRALTVALHRTMSQFFGQVAPVSRPQDSEL